MGNGTVTTTARLLTSISSRWSPVGKVSAADLLKGKLRVYQPYEFDVRTLTLMPPLRRLAEAEE